jgi:hypothetical protein
MLADTLGYDVEHHGLYEYSHSSAPEILLSYLAAKTTRPAARPCRHADAVPPQSCDLRADCFELDRAELDGLTRDRPDKSAGGGRRRSGLPATRFRLNLEEGSYRPLQQVGVR